MASTQAEIQTESRVFQAPETEITRPAENFSCDGRQHCSQMRSRAEAEYFVRNCPNTKMDGDNDGIPCENDSRF
ncbi:excalibur calcium-binding domain-containing protein [Azoarcus sp. CIB]|uniref:excalibur calcium-binding domain-containing protein n=1 Tax=Aromatoleum sp. (strain CIB) TaxID=198107 RepID=UPI003369DC18